MSTLSAFSSSFESATQNFQSIANSLKNPFEDMSVTPDQLTALEEADTTTTAKVERAAERLPKVEQGFTGANRGHWGATAFSIISVMIMAAPLSLSLVAFVKGIQDEEAGVPTSQLVTQFASEIFACITTIYWYLHARNARKAKEYASISAHDSEAVTHMNQFAKAAHGLNQTVYSYNNGEITNNSCTENMARFYQEMDAAYRKLPPAEQKTLGNLTLIKERYLQLLPGGENGQSLRKKYDRMRIFGQVLNNSIPKWGLKHKNVPDDARKGDPAALMELGSKALDAASGALLNLNDDNLRKVLKTNPRYTKMYLRKQWVSLMIYTGHLDSFDIGLANLNIRCGLNGRVFHLEAAQLSAAAIAPPHLAYNPLLEEQDPLNEPLIPPLGVYPDVADLPV